MKTRIGHIELFCSDVQKTTDWYVEKLGASLVADQGQFQWVDIGGTELLLRPGNGSQEGSYRESAMTFVLYVEDAAAYKDQLQNNGIDVTHGDNDECLTFQDPDGHWIQAVQN